jgi:hypothetical protein
METMTPTLSCHGAFALELSPGTGVARDLLGADAAGALAALVSRDLAKLAPEAAGLDLALLAGLFDPVELLRPGWPLHRELERLIAQAPGADGGRVIAFGAGTRGDAGTDARAGGGDGNTDAPANLRPDRDFAGGALRLLPFVLRGEATLASRVAENLEAILLDTGMAGADTALLAQEAFGATIEHARYLTVHDLTAMIAMQYENVGLGALWPVLETALLSPGQECWLDQPPEPMVHLVDGQARIAMLDDDAWLTLQPEEMRNAESARIERSFIRFQMRQRQIAALLEAHGIPVTFDHCPSGVDPRASLSS